jgi:hypothetical protein
VTTTPPKPKPQCRADGFPRRACVYLHTPAELAISKAIDEVEKLPAHEWETEAVLLLDKARERVADLVESLGITTPSPDAPKPFKAAKPDATAEQIRLVVGPACGSCGHLRGYHHPANGSPCVYGECKCRGFVMPAPPERATPDDALWSTLADVVAECPTVPPAQAPEEF